MDEVCSFSKPKLFAGISLQEAKPIPETHKGVQVRPNVIKMRAAVSHMSLARPVDLQICKLPIASLSVASLPQQSRSKSCPLQ